MHLFALLQFSLVAAALVSPVVTAKKHSTSTSTSTTKAPKPTKTPKPCKPGKHSKHCPSPPPGGNTTQPSAPDAFNSAWLFPVAFKSAFSTSPQAAKQANVQLVSLDDQALGVVKQTSGLTHAVIDVDGTDAWEAVYPKGSYNPSGKPRGGFGFYLGGPSGFDFGEANELLFSYAVKFDDGFEFNKGGKLPGPYGGSTEDLAYGCSGGRQDARDACFDLRLMFRTAGAGEVYAYLPEVKENDQALLNLPNTTQDGSYGISIQRGAYKFTPGQWTVVAERVKLNGVGKADGQIQLFVDGKSVINVSGLVVRQHKETVFRGGHIQTFFGGATKEWGSPKEQKAWFAGVSAAIIS